MHRINGVDPATFEGTLDAHLARVHPDDVDALREAFATAVSTRRPFDVEYTESGTATGADRWALLAGPKPTFSGRPALVVGTNQWVRPGRHRPSRHRQQRRLIVVSRRTDGLADEVGGHWSTRSAPTYRRRRRPGLTSPPAWCCSTMSATVRSAWTDVADGRPRPRSRHLLGRRGLHAAPGRRRRSPPWREHRGRSQRRERPTRSRLDLLASRYSLTTTSG